MTWSALRPKPNAIYYCLTKSSRKPIIFYGLSDKYRFGHYHSSTSTVINRHLTSTFLPFNSFLITRQKIRKLVELLVSIKALSNSKETMGTTKSIYRCRQYSLFGFISRLLPLVLKLPLKVTLMKLSFYQSNNNLI